MCSPDPIPNEERDTPLHIHLPPLLFSVGDPELLGRGVGK